MRFTFFICSTQSKKPSELKINTEEAPPEFIEKVISPATSNTENVFKILAKHHDIKHAYVRLSQDSIAVADSDEKNPGIAVFDDKSAQCARFIKYPGTRHLKLYWAGQQLWTSALELDSNKFMLKRWDIAEEKVLNELEISLKYGKKLDSRTPNARQRRADAAVKSAAIYFTTNERTNFPELMCHVPSQNAVHTFGLIYNNFIRTTLYEDDQYCSLPIHYHRKNNLLVVPQYQQYAFMQASVAKESDPQDEQKAVSHAVRELRDNLFLMFEVLGLSMQLYVFAKSQQAKQGSDYICVNQLIIEDYQLKFLMELPNDILLFSDNKNKLYAWSCLQKETKPKLFLTVGNSSHIRDVFLMDDLLIVKSRSRTGDTKMRLFKLKNLDKFLQYSLPQTIPTGDGAKYPQPFKKSV